MRMHFMTGAVIRTSITAMETVQFQSLHLQSLMVKQYTL